MCQFVFAGRRVWQQGVTLSVLVCVCREEGMVAGCNPQCAGLYCREEGVVAGCDPQCAGLCLQGRRVWWQGVTLSVLVCVVGRRV